MGSLVTGSKQALIEQIQTLSPLVDQGVLFGIHLEGPWISKLHCGAHDKPQLRAPEASEVGELLAVGGGRIKMVTIARNSLARSRRFIRSFVPERLPQSGIPMPTMRWRKSRSRKAPPSRHICRMRCDRFITATLVRSEP